MIWGKNMPWDERTIDSKRRLLMYDSCQCSFSFRSDRPKKYDPPYEPSMFILYIVAMMG